VYASSFNTFGRSGLCFQLQDIEINLLLEPPMLGKPRPTTTIAIYRPMIPVRCMDCG